MNRLAGASAVGGTLWLNFRDAPLLSITFGTEARKYNCASMQNGQVANLGNKFTISFWLNSANLGKTASGTAVSEYLFVGMVPSGQFAILH